MQVTENSQPGLGCLALHIDPRCCHPLSGWKEEILPACEIGSTTKNCLTARATEVMEQVPGEKPGVSPSWSMGSISMSQCDLHKVMRAHLGRERH